MDLPLLAGREVDPSYRAQSYKADEFFATPFWGWGCATHRVNGWASDHGPKAVAFSSGFSHQGKKSTSVVGW